MKKNIMILTRETCDFCEGKGKDFVHPSHREYEAQHGETTMTNAEREVHREEWFRANGKLIDSVKNMVPVQVVPERLVQVCPVCKGEGHTDQFRDAAEVIEAAMEEALSESGMSLNLSQDFGSLNTTDTDQSEAKTPAAAVTAPTGGTVPEASKDQAQPTSTKNSSK